MDESIKNIQGGERLYGSLLLDPSGNILECSWSSSVKHIDDLPELKNLDLLLSRGFAGEEIEAHSELTFFGRNSRMRGTPMASGRLLLTFDEPKVASADARVLLNRIRELEFITHHLRQGIWRLDPAGVIVEVNPYMAQWLETTPGKLLGVSSLQFRQDQNIDLDTAKAGRYEAEFLTQTGLVRRAIVTHSPVFSPSHEPVGSVELITDITAEHALRARLVQEVNRMQNLAHLDPLTQLSNRRAFDMAIQSLGETPGTSDYGVILLDFDGLKKINDSLGHAVGDAALVAFANHLKSSIRDQDMLARIGGDEFAILVHGVSNEELASIGERMRKQAKTILPVEGFVLELQASLGWAHRSQGERLITLADAKMYEHKRGSKRESEGKLL